MTNPDGRFYVTGGTLSSEAPSYILRSADDELYNSLIQGEFSYVLTARQMGKSSLMVNTATKLNRAGVTTVLLDLSALGQNVTLEQWYFGVLANICEQLGIDEGLSEHWKRDVDFAPQQRCMRSLREYVLGKASGPIVLFVDEIDIVRSLPFRTDEFFAGIRELYNRRSRDPEARRLTFCLLGVATPAELIQDPDTTPFNIGMRIPLADFSFEEAERLALGFGYGRDSYGLLKRVFDWTDGHPYLTQRLCRAIADDPYAVTATDADEACKKLFLSHEGQRDDNLLFVRDRLLDPDKTEVLKMYLRVLRRPCQAESLSAGTLASLILSGAVKVRNGMVRVRNRLYARAFDRKWVLNHLPKAETQQTKKAMWMGAAVAALSLGAATAGFGLFCLAASHNRPLPTPAAVVKSAASSEKANSPFSTASKTVNPL